MAYLKEFVEGLASGMPVEKRRESGWEVGLE
jgi:hypothetical protein